MRAAVVVAVIAAAMAGVASARTLVEPHPGVPDSYTHVARADPETRLTVTIAVKQTNTDVLESTLIRVSDPEHADWNKLMTFEEVNALVAPRPESIARVVGFLKEHKVASEAITATPNSDFLNVETTVEVAEAMLGAEYHVYEHTATQSRIVRLSGEYSLPSEIAEHVDFVGPTGASRRATCAVVLCDELCMMCLAIAGRSFLHRALGSPLHALTLLLLLLACRW